MIHSFKPIYDENSKVLILGSMPSIKSLEDEMYYANPRNSFWELMCEITGDDCGKTNESKTKFLHRNSIALFDVIKSCERNGSLDSNIKNVIPNDIVSIVDSIQNLKLIVLNGGTAARYYKKYDMSLINRKTMFLPSTSPANAKGGYAAKLNEWKKIINYL